MSKSYGLWIVTLSLLARAFFSWYRLSKKNVMVLILALSMVAYVVNGILSLCAQINFLAQHNLIIRSGDVAFFPVFSSATLGDLINIASQITSSVAYVLTWIGTVMLLRPYMIKLGSIKFWTIMSAAYGLLSYPISSFCSRILQPIRRCKCNGQPPYFFNVCSFYRNRIWGRYFIRSKNSKKR